MWWFYLLVILQVLWTGGITKQQNRNVVIVNINKSKHVNQRKHYDRSELLTIRNTMTGNNMLNKVPFAAIKSVRSLGLNKRKKRRHRKYHDQPIRRIQHNNLREIQRKEVGQIHTNKLKIATINVRSLKNKESVVYNYVIEKSLDIVVLTETWILDSDKDWLHTTDFSLNGFQMFSAHRTERRGGGVSILV